MEVDTGSSAFQMIRTTSKRTRSPETPSPVDRPAKRFTFEMESRGHTPLSDTGSLYDASRKNAGLHRSEEWVTRTGSLNLGNPQLAQQTEAVLLNPHQDADTSMDMDDGQPPVQYQHEQAHSTQGMTTTTPAPRYPVSHLPNFYPSSAAHVLQSTPATSLVFPPPAPRFRMGPRVDCEKCRLGVPGHYAHF